MKKLRIFYKITLIGVLSLLVLGGCEEAAELSIDPVVSKTDFTFAPEVGYPGTNVVITGTNLADVQKVAFGTAEAEVTSKSATEIKVKVPVKATSGKIFLTFKDKVFSSDASFSVSSSPIPTITEFAPLEVGREGEVVITGLLLDKVKRVYVGKFEAEIVDQSATEITIIAPEEFVSSPISLIYDYTTTYGLVKETSSLSAIDLGLLLPSISLVEPGLVGLSIGDELTISGSSLDLVEAIKFGDVEVGKDNFTLTDGVITVVVPEGATSGTLTLVAEDGSYDFDTSFSVLLPKISSFTPQKGSPTPGENRPFSIIGSDLQVVDSVLVGGVKAEIITQSSTQLLLSVDGTSNGTVSLYSSNGVVNGSAPFAFVGDFWVNDWDTTFDVIRFDKFANNNLGTFTPEIVEGDGGNHYAKLTMEKFENGNSFYLWGPDVGGDRFSLYVSDPQGVYLEFDLKVESIDDVVKQDDGTLQFKIYTMDSKGWGASGEYSYGANGPTSYVGTDGEWHHFRMHLKDFIASDNSGLYNPGQVDGIAGAWCHPNSIRILAFVFGVGTEGAKGNATVGLDNVKFVIE
ncbi:MAG TPA: IPT/TIG domain-containing protein [Marinilabiliaceae bacterium]|nr:IPT/TIG domain-containing protein [Marinilabiliaceae bacterium]